MSEYWGQPRIMWTVEDLAERWGCSFMEAKCIVLTAGVPEFTRPDGAYLITEDELSGNFEDYISTELAEKRFADARLVLLKMSADHLAADMQEIDCGAYAERMAKTVCAVG